MNTLKLTISSSLYSDPVVLVDDEKIKIKRNEFGSYTCNYETSRNEVDIKIYKYLEINSPLWFLTYMFFFFISIFGLLDYKLDKKCLKIEYHSRIKFDGEAKLKLSIKAAKEEAIKAETDSEYIIIENNTFVDEEAKRRLKILKIAKIICWVLLIGISAFLTLRTIM